MFFHLIFAGYPLVGWFIAAQVLVKPLRLPAWLKFAVDALMLVAALKFVFYARIGGSMFCPDIPQAAFIAWSIAFAATMIFSGFGVLVLLGRGLRALGRKWRQRRGRGKPPPAPDPSANGACSRRGFLTGAAALVAAGTSAHGVEAGLCAPEVVQVEIPFPDLPEEFDGYRIVQLSDLHVSAALPAARTKMLVQLANSLHGDLVAITGDFVDGSVQDRRVDVKPLAGLWAPDGVYGCAGNHEYYSNYVEWKPVLEEFGVRMLDNEHVVLQRGAGMLALGGVPDHIGGDFRLYQVYRGMPAGAFRILLMHRPIRTLLTAHFGVRLQLSGHTHGGGLNVMRPLVAPANDGHIRGLYSENGLKLYVNAGSGQWAGFPMRLGNPSEITVITLRHGR